MDQQRPAAGSPAPTPEGQPEDGTVLRPLGGAVTEPEDGTVLRPLAGSPATPDDGTILRPLAGSPATPDDGTILRPLAGSPATPDDGTILRPLAGDPQVGTVLHPLGAADGGTVLRPAPGPRSAGSLPPTEPPITRADEVPTYAEAATRYRVPQDRFVAPPPPTTRRSRKLPVRAMVTWLLVLMLLGVAAGVIYVRYLRTPEADPAVKLPDTTASASVTVRQPDELVRAYLTALSTGDVATALALGGSESTGSKALLTAQAYAESLRAAPISNIQVTNTDPSVTDIPASYSLGDTPVKTSFKVAKQDDGSWRLVTTTVSYRFQATNAQQVPLRVNGVAVDLDTPIQLLPGRYTMSTGLPFVGFDAGSALTVSDLKQTDLVSHSLTPVITAQGSAALLQAAQTSLTQCLNRRELTPDNCPLAMTSSRPVQANSIRWAAVGDQWQGATPALSPADQSVGEITLSLNLTIAVQYTSGGGLSPSPYRRNATVSASLLVQSAEELQVRWRVN